MLRNALPATLFALAALCVASAWSGEPIGEADYARVNAALVEGHVVPRYARLAEATGAFAAAGDVCTGGGAESGRDAARARFHDAMDAWMAVRHLRFGPIELFMRGPRFYFWPEARGKVREALQALAAEAEGDEAALLPPRFEQTNVAVQGLLAAETLLYDEERLGIPTGAGSVGCRVLRAVAGNLHDMAAGMAAGWRSGDAAFARTATQPGPANDYFQDHREATLAFFQSLHDGLRFIADVRLRPVVGDSLQEARPHAAESRASARSMRNVIVNLDALQALYLGEGGPGLAALAGAADAKLDRLLRKAFRLTLETARSLEGPLEEAATDPATRAKAEELTTRVRALRQIVRDRLAPALGFPVGFNALDGD